MCKKIEYETVALVMPTKLHMASYFFAIILSLAFIKSRSQRSRWNIFELIFASLFFEKKLSLCLFSHHTTLLIANVVTFTAQYKNNRCCYSTLEWLRAVYLVDLCGYDVDLLPPPKRYKYERINMENIFLLDLYAKILFQSIELIVIC